MHPIGSSSTHCIRLCSVVILEDMASRHRLSIYRMEWLAVCTSALYATMTNGVQNLSGLNECLIQILTPLYQSENQPVHPAVYGDAIFTPLATIMRPYQNPNDVQRIVNTRMSSLREDTEHKFSQVFNLYQVLRCACRHNLFWNADFVRKLFFNCLFVSNCYTCFNESRNRQFNLRAPSYSGKVLAVRWSYRSSSSCRRKS